MSKERTGSLVLRRGGYSVVLTLDVEGETIRKPFPLGTRDKTIARRKADRLVAQQRTALPKELEASAAVLETYAEASARIRALRRAQGLKDIDNEEGRDRLYVIPRLGGRDVCTVKSSDVRAVLDAALAVGKSYGTLQHIRHAMHTVFDSLWRDEVIGENPVARVRVPKGKRDRRERAVLTDNELAIYLAWQHPDERHRHAVLERQCMSIIARTFGGLRTGDLHVLRWESLDAANGAFAFGWAPRKKTSRPQMLEIPSMLRPYLRDWWERHGRPATGLIFPALTGDKASHGVKQHVSHARAMRRDLQRAFRSANRSASAPQPGSVRWAELFEEGAHTRPVDFHSWRRAYNQALANAGVSAQQASALAGHADLGAHARYLHNTASMRTIPEAALPTLGVSHAADTIQTTATSQVLEIWGERRELNPRHPEPQGDAAYPDALKRGDSAIHVGSVNTAEHGYPAARAIGEHDSVVTLRARPANAIALIRAADRALVDGQVAAARALLASAVAWLETRTAAQHRGGAK